MLYQKVIQYLIYHNQTVSKIVLIIQFNKASLFTFTFSKSYSSIHNSLSIMRFAIFFIVSCLALLTSAGRPNIYVTNEGSIYLNYHMITFYSPVLFINML